MGTSRGSIRLRDLLAMVFVASLLGGVLVPALVRLLAEGARRSCVNNLRQLGTYVCMYVSKLG